jgi:REP element-mobilizing transposase RayT
MPRIRRLLIKGEQAVYHVISRTALDGYPLGDVEKERFVELLRKKSRIYFTDILGFCVMGNHFHLLVRMLPEADFSDEEVRQRYGSVHPEGEKGFPEGAMALLRQKWASVSEFTRELKVDFARFYNKRHGRRGYFWGDRFKSVIVEKGETLIHCLAYIDLNPVRAGLVERPEDYRWSSLGYHVQSGNRDGWLSLDFGLATGGRMPAQEGLRHYRRHVYEVGAIRPADKPGAGIIDESVLSKERESGFEMDRVRRFRYRTRYFTDSGVIGTKDFVAEHFRRFRVLIGSQHERKPKPVRGIAGMYSLKRLSETAPVVL